MPPLNNNPKPRPGVILASGSTTRKALLTAAGLSFCVIIPPFDEEAAKRSLGAVSAATLAIQLAKGKALSQSKLTPHHLIIGADQVLSLGDRIISKAQSLPEARQTLTDLRGKTHELTSAVACISAGHILWSHTASAQMTMREFSDEFLDNYLSDHGTEALHAVGCYQFETHGVQLFETVTGDIHTIMGLPLLPLLNFLRQEGHLPS